MRLAVLACAIVVGCDHAPALDVEAMSNATHGFAGAESSEGSSTGQGGAGGGGSGSGGSASGGSARGGGSSTSGPDETSDATSSTSTTGDEGMSGTGELGESIEIVGTIEAGPFVQGSTVQIAALDPHGSPVGVTVMTEVIDDAGAFGPVEAPTGLVLVTATGHYFDIDANAISDAPLVLEVVAIADENPLHVNVLGHLATPRILGRLGQGEPIADAFDDGYDSLIHAIEATYTGYHPTPPVPSTGLSLQGPDSDSAALLLATVVTLQSKARVDGPDAPTAALQTLVDGVANGDVSYSVWYPLYYSIDLAEQEIIEDRVLAFYATVGAEASRIHLSRLTDVDHDERNDFDENCPEFWNIAQEDDDDDGIGDACDCDLAGPDDDADGWPNGCDSCIDVPNLPHASQFGGYWGNNNKDFDDWGDACDSCPRSAGVGGVADENCCDPREYVCYKNVPHSGLSYRCALHSNGDRFECADSDGSNHGYGNQWFATNNWPRVPPGGLPSPQPCADPDEWCETRWCDVGDDAACNNAQIDGVSCIPWFAVENAPPGLENLGICAIADVGPCAGVVGRECAGW